MTDKAREAGDGVLLEAERLANFARGSTVSGRNATMAGSRKPSPPSFAGRMKGRSPA
jgi:hypothetical protein